MSEEQFFATLGFSTEEAASEAQSILVALKDRTSEYNTILPGIKEPEYFVDALCGSQIFGRVLMADWFSGDLLNGTSITKNLKLLNPKYQSLEFYRDTGSSTKTGYIDDKKTNYRTVLDTLAKESQAVGYTLALLESKSKTVKEFLDTGHDPHASSFGRDVLLKVDFQSSGPLALALIEAGADLTPVDKKGRTPLIKAVEYRRDKIVKAIIEAEGDVNFASPLDGRTAAHYCAGNDAIDKKIMRLLSKGGADLNHSDYAGYTPLLKFLDYHYSEAALDTLELYIKLGADIHYYDERIGNATWLAIENDLPDCKEFLISQGVSPKAPVPKEPVPLPEDPKITEILNLFNEHEALTASLLNDGPDSDIFWPDHDKKWLKQRKELWKYIETSIKEWFCGNIKASAIKELKKYYIQGYPFSKEVQKQGVVPTLDFHHPLSKDCELRGLGPLFLTWLHPSSDMEVLKKFVPNDFDFYHIRYYLFKTFNSGNRRTQCGVAPSRLQILAPLFVPYCYLHVPVENRGEMIQGFISLYCQGVPGFLNYSKILGGYTGDLFNDFIKFLGMCFEENIPLEDKNIRLVHKGKEIHTISFKYMMDSIEKFSVDGMPYAKVEPALKFIADFKKASGEYPLKEFVDKFS